MPRPKRKTGVTPSDREVGATPPAKKQYVERSEEPEKVPESVERWDDALRLVDERVEAQIVDFRPFGEHSACWDADFYVKWEGEVDDEADDETIYKINRSLALEFR